MTLEEALADAYCPCHGEPWYVQPGGKRAGRRFCRAVRRQCDARFSRSEKGREKKKRYAETGKAREASARYNRSEKGRARNRRYGATPEYRSRNLVRMDDYRRRKRLKEAGLL